MNKKYIKRQFTLLNLGISLSDEIQDYYDTFMLLYNGLGELKICNKRNDENEIHWENNKNNIVLTYHVDTNTIFIKNFFFEYFMIKYKISNDDLELILTNILQYILEIEISDIDNIDLYDSLIDEDMFNDYIQFL